MPFIIPNSQRLIEASGFAHLHAHSYYSFFDSTMSPEEMVEAAVADGATAMAITDTNSLTGAVIFYKAAKQAGIKPILGVELTQPLPVDRKIFRARARVGRTAVPAAEDEQAEANSGGARPWEGGGSQSPALCHGDPMRRAVLLARSFEGYSEISQMVTRRMLEPEFDLFGELCGLSDQVIVLSDSVEVLRAAWNFREEKSAPVESAIPLLYGMLTPSRRRRKQNRQVYECALALGVPLTVGCDAKMVSPGECGLHTLLQAMRRLTTVQRIPEAERIDPAQHLQPARKVYAHFLGGAVYKFHSGDKFPHSKLDAETVAFLGVLREALGNTTRIAEQCNCELSLKKWWFPQLRDLPKPPRVLLREMVQEGMRWRYGEPLPTAAEQRMTSELEVIDRLGFNEYFLLVNEIVSEAKRRGFFTLGRGSGANSILSYALGFTNVCPIQFNLYFERFLNPDRSAPPDIDIDFSWRERDEIIQWCFDRFGHENVALICTLQTLQSRQAVREVAKAHGLCELEVNAFNKLRETGYRIEEPGAGGRIRNMAEEEPWNTVLEQARRITNFPRHLSIHCGGILITPRSVADFVPLTRSAKGFVITQMDMFSVEDLGLVKIDLLSNRSLGVLKDALRSVGEEQKPIPIPTPKDEEEAGEQAANSELKTEVFQREAVRMKLAGTRRGTSVALAGVLGAFSEGGQFVGEARGVMPDAPLRKRIFDFAHVTNDADTRRLIDAGQTMGCFYIESPGMRALFERLRCKNFEEVVTASSIIRPGVAESGMMQEYIARHQTVAERQNYEMKEGGETEASLGPHLECGDMSPHSPDDTEGPKRRHATALQNGLSRETERADLPGSRSVAVALELTHPTLTSRSDSTNSELDFRAPATLLPATPASHRLASGAMPINAHAKAHVFKEALQPDREKGPEPKRLRIHPLMMELLPETYGVMVYQEDVLCVAHDLAGMTFAEADLLRRAISGKMRSRDAMVKLHEKFVAGAMARGLPEEDAREVWRQMASFAGYSFCKGHSAAFAVLSYQVAYLKAHYPAEFFAGVLSNQGGFYGPGAYLEEARRWGLRVLPPCINESQEDYVGQTETAPHGWVRIGLMAVMSISQASREDLLRVREWGGAFASLEDFVRRARCGLEECRQLIKAGAFDVHATCSVAGVDVSQRLAWRRGLLLQAECLYRTRDAEADSFVKLDLPMWKPGAQRGGVGGERAAHELAAMEQEALGFSVTSHPLDLVQVPPDVVLARDIREHRGKRIIMAGWVISIKLIATKTDGRTMKMMTLEDRSGTFEAVLFPKVYNRFVPRTLTRGPYLVRGLVDMTLGSPTLNVEHIRLLAGN